MTRRALFKPTALPEADVRPTLLGIVTLLFLLLFFLLSTSTGQRLGIVDVKAAAAEELASLPHTGLVKEVLIDLRGGTAVVTAAVQTTDIAASATTTERRQIPVPITDEGHVDLAALGNALQTIKDIDPSQEKVVLLPNPDTNVQTLLGVMDTARGLGGATLFPKVMLGGQGS